MTTRNLQVAASADDADENESVNVVITNATIGPIRSGAPTRKAFAGFRFNNVTVAQGTTLTSATFRLYITAGSVVGHYVYGELHTDAPAFAATGSNISGRTKTTAVATIGGTPSIGSYLDIDLTAVVQEIINQGGWVSGNDLVLIVDAYTPSITSSSAITVQGYDGSSTNAAKLDIVFSSGGTPVSVDFVLDTDWNLSVRSDAVITVAAEVTIAGGGVCSFEQRLELAGDGVLTSEARLSLSIDSVLATAVQEGAQADSQAAIDALADIRADLALADDWRGELALDQTIADAWQESMSADLGVLPTDGLAGVQADPALGVEWWALVAFDQVLEIEHRLSLAFNAGELPTAGYEGARADAALAEDWLLELARDSVVPYESTITLIPIEEDYELPLDWLLRVSLDSDVTTEWKGVFLVDVSNTLPIERLLTARRDSQTAIVYGGALAVDGETPITWWSPISVSPALATEAKLDLVRDAVLPAAAYQGTLRDAVITDDWRLQLALDSNPLATNWGGGIERSSVLPTERKLDLRRDENTVDVEHLATILRDVLLPIVVRPTIASDHVLTEDWRGSVGRSAVLAEEWRSQLEASSVLPLERLAALARDNVVDVDWSNPYVLIDYALPLERKASIARSDAVATESKQAVQRDAVAPVDRLAQVLRDSILAPQWGGTIDLSSWVAPAEWRGQLDVAAVVPTERRTELVIAAAAPTAWFEEVAPHTEIVALAWYAGLVTSGVLPVAWSSEEPPNIAGGVFVLGPRGLLWELPARHALFALPERDLLFVI